MKKTMSIVLALAMLLMLLAGCSQATPETKKQEPTTPATEAVSTAAVENQGESTDKPSYKIGFSYYTFSDSLGSAFKRVLEYTAKELNCEMLFLEWPTTSIEGAVEANENLVEAGCDGIITGFVTPAVLDACEKANVPFIMTCGIINDESLLEKCVASNTFVGMISEDDYKAGYDMLQGLYDDGARNIAYLANAPGSSTAHDNRVRGMEKFLEEHPDMNLVSSFRGDGSEQANAARQIWTAYPEIDGIAVTGNNGAIIAAIYADGLQDRIKFAGVDIQENTDVYLEDGTMSWVAGGQFPTMQISFTLLYNYLTGNQMIQDKAQPLYRPFMYISSPEEYQDYVTYMEGDVPAYTGDELRALCTVFNPDANLKTIEDYNNNYSIQDLVERHKDLY